MDRETLTAIREALARGESVALATIVDTRGSTPQRAGAALVLRDGGAMTGTLGGGCIEAEAAEVAADVLASGRARLLDFELTEDIAVDYGLACGGRERIYVTRVTAGAANVAATRELLAAIDAHQPIAIAMRLAEDDAPSPFAAVVSPDGAARAGEIADEALRVLAGPHPRPRVLRLATGDELYVEPITPPVEVVVVGAGHVGRAVASAAAFLGHRVVVIDDRADFANNERFPGAEVICGDIGASISARVVSPSCAVVIVTRGHKYDYEALAAAVRTPAFYVGLMGSRRKVALIYRQLAADGVPAERLRDVRAPIGLDIGAVTPEEIALSIMAEITAARLGGSGAPMKASERVIGAATSHARA
jgi:xanthine dehydrogenase accessory factor